MNELIKTYLMNEIDSSANQIRIIDERIKAFSEHEDGYLSICNCKNTHQFYIVQKNGTRSYLKKKDTERVNNFMQNYHDSRISRQIKKWNKSCRNFLRAAQNRDDIYKDFPPFLRESVITIGSATESWAQNWEDCGHFQERKNEIYPIKTLRGDFVRSKSEALIADKLHLAGLHYRYEDEIRIGNNSYRPDFQIVHPITGEIIVWEHFGMMDNADYMTRAFGKIDAYAEIGYNVGNNFIVTLEGGHAPLNMNTVISNIEQKFGVKVGDIESNQA